MRESFTYGSVGRALRKQCLYPEIDLKNTVGLRLIISSTAKHLFHVLELT